MVINRPFWIQRIEETWKKVPIVWLSGVRRIGKTTLAHSLKNAKYFDCDTPRTKELLKDPEAFYGSLSEKRIILDEVHQLPDPSLVLKIGADLFPQIKILATGSSTLAATQKFKDSLTGRKRVVHMLPVLSDELEAFGIKDLRYRLLRGGLPPALLSSEHDEGFYSEWLDSYYARDVQELFRVEKRSGFLLLIEILLRQNAGLVEVSGLAQKCSLSRPTIMNYLEILELTHLIYVLRPYHGGGKQELVRRPKIYGFDTGFICYARGWNELRLEDCGLLWENLVLEHLLSLPSQPKAYHWRDQQQHEIDFVIPRGRDRCDAIECKWNADGFKTQNLKVFRSIYPKGTNFVVSPHITASYQRQVHELKIEFVGLSALKG